MRSYAVILIAVCALVVSARRAAADVDVSWVPDVQSVAFGSTVRVGLTLTSDNGLDQTIAGLDVVVTWDPKVLRLEGVVDDGPYAWLMSGFQPDDALDGLNNSLLDGDAKYTALAFPGFPAVATPDGLLVTTFAFTAIGPADASRVVIEPELGQYSVTRVFGADAPNQDVTGTLGEATVTVGTPAYLSVSELVLPANRIGYFAVYGEIEEEWTFGTTITLELSAQQRNEGSVVFTPAPPVDIVRLDDPWGGIGGFTPFDTDLAGATNFNGCIIDNGTFIPDPVVFAGALAAFAIETSADAAGTWDVTLFGAASWEGVPTAYRQGTIRIAGAGDCDGNEAIDVSDWSHFQMCYTGDQGGSVPPAYLLSHEPCCGVFDFDGDGDVDLTDFEEFRAAMTGP